MSFKRQNLYALSAHDKKRRIFYLCGQKGYENIMKKVAIIMGSDSDLPKVKPAADVLKKFSVPFEVRVISAHRTPQEAMEFASSAKENGFGVIIAAAGKAAHLAGAMAANTVLPVIGIPVLSSSTSGMDALLSTVQMPSGIPVATVAIDGSANAAYLAVQMLSLEDEGLYTKLCETRAAMADEVRAKDAKVKAEF